MTTLYDLGMEVSHIREALDSLEVKGHKNVSILNFAFARCNAIIDAINKIAKESEEIQNGSREVDVDGEDNTGTVG